MDSAQPAEQKKRFAILSSIQFQMILEENTFYHVFNQGNDRVKIFYKKDNYHYFLKKLKQFFIPYVSIVCYCLMPNHFHLLIYPKQDIDNKLFTKDLATCLRSYTRAINKQEGKTGSLFRAHTKFKSDTKDSFITVNNKELSNPNRYARTCFEYIHQNPVKANMVLKAEDWEFSSAKDYLGLREATLCNLKLGKEIFEN